ncbi:helix-turn-helix domain-containing protein [Leptospira interrogans]
MHTSIDQLSSVRGLRLQPARFASPAMDLDECLERAALRRIEAKEFLFADGDQVSHLYRIETGTVMFKVLADGRRQVMGFAFPGDLIGLGVEGEHVMNAQAVKATRLRSLPLTMLRQATANNPALCLKLYEALSRELAATRDLMLTTGQRSAMERLTGFLLALSRRNARNGLDAARFDLPMTRTDIGDFLGLTIETVSRTFTKLKKMGLIELPRCNEVKLLEVDQIERMANGEGQAA